MYGKLLMPLGKISVCLRGHDAQCTDQQCGNCHNAFLMDCTAGWEFPFTVAFTVWKSDF